MTVGLSSQLGLALEFQNDVFKKLDKKHLEIVKASLIRVSVALSDKWVEFRIASRQRSL